MNFNSDNKKQILAAITIVVSICFLSCTKKNTAATTVSTQPLPDMVSFSGDVIPVFNMYCSTSGCHSGSTPAGGLNLLASMAYSQLFAKHEVDTVNVNSSNLYIEMASGAMPKGGKVNAYNVNLVQKWIQQKAKNN